MAGTRDLHRRAIEDFGRRVHAVRGDQWPAPTPCTEWDVRALVNHLVVEQLWVPPLLAGRTIEEVGDRLDGDLLGADPVGAWDRAAADAVAAFEPADALERTVHLSYGDVPGRSYLQQMTLDLVVHAWDLARGIGADPALDAELVQVALDEVAPYADQLQASGLFAPVVDVPADADPQTRLLAMTGRRA